LIGDDGGDLLDGGSGIDSMIGGTGDDRYVLDSIGDTIIEYANEGIDSVFTPFDYTLGATLERLQIAFGSGPVNATGNDLDNFIGGNEFDNILDGRGGADQMAGYGGNDTYIVDNANDLVMAYQGFDRVRTSVSYNLLSDNSSEVDPLETTNQAGTGAIDLVGNEFNQTIVGNNGQNTIAGSRAGNDLNFDGVEDYDGLDVMTGNGGGDVFCLDIYQ
jgi:Ca2+-binding RTX toxin-like protein